MAVVATKIHAHGLTRTTSGLSGHYCDGCRATLMGESYRCGPCNFDLCGACFGKNKSTQATRVHAHPVTYTNTGLDRHYCDVCSAATTREAWRCASCNFDVCTTCFETLSAPKPAAVARPATAAAAAGDAKAPLTVAQHAHPLVSTSGLSGHYCDACKGAVTTSYRCAPCNWDLCAPCYTKSKQRISRLHAHPITHTTTGLELHYCDGCRVPTETESWRCAECNFDLCKDCTTRSSAPKATEVKAAAPAAAAAAAAPAAAAVTELKCHPHALKRTTHGLKGHHCDGCRASPLSVSFRCDECNFDLCSACNESTHKQSLSLHPHAVQWTTVGLAGHYCNVCRVVMEGAHPQAWRCHGCDFDVCQACVTRIKTPKPTPAARPAAAPATAAATEVKAEPVMTKAHQHGLLRTTTGLSGHHCDGCRATGLAVAHRCNSCDFDLCESCFSRNRLAHTSRMHAHPLAFARGLRDHWCDDCRTPCTSAWRCDDCNFDLCLGCFARAKLPKPAPVAPVAAAAAAAAPVAVAVAARPTEVKVERHSVKGHAHPVSVVSTGLTGHFCDSCNASPLTSAYRCHECNYDVCSGCFETARTEVSSRVHTHPLRWSAGLEAHYCDVCRKTTADMYRCDTCNFDCCTTCLRAAQAPAAAVAVAAPSAPAAPVAVAPVAAAPAAAFWSCSACTYVNPALASTCYICSTSKA